MKITTLIENKGDVAGVLESEHGLSMLIEFGGQRILFDTGKTGAFIRNADKLGVDLAAIDAVILSHAHYDHAGGICDLLNKYDKRFKIIIGSEFFTNGDKYHVEHDKGEIHYRYNGISFDENYLLRHKADIVYIKPGMTEIAENIYVFSGFTEACAFEESNADLVVKQSNQYKVDCFSEEIALGIRLPQGLLLFIGCGHPGATNMVETVVNLTGERVFGIIGGIHLVNADEARLEKSITEMKRLGVEYLGLAHCTGERAVKRIEEVFGQVVENRTGMVINR